MLLCNEFRRIRKRVVVAYLRHYPDRRELQKTSVRIAGVSVLRFEKGTNHIWQLRTMYLSNRLWFSSDSTVPVIGLEGFMHFVPCMT